jgi:hypothetical protein
MLESLNGPDCLLMQHLQPPRRQLTLFSVAVTKPSLSNTNIATLPPQFVILTQSLRISPRTTALPLSCKQPNQAQPLRARAQSSAHPDTAGRVARVHAHT